MNMWPYILLFLLATFSACGLLGGEGKEPLEPGPRNYTWTVDTLANGPSGWINDIWGSSPDNVWAVTTGGLYHLWHYDGQTWAPESLSIFMNGFSIYGFAEDDIWVGGSDGKLYHFNGLEWRMAFQYTFENMYDASIWSIWGNSPSDIYAVGNLHETGAPTYRSFLLHYDGKTWEELATTKLGVFFNRVRTEVQNVYIQARQRYSSPDSSLFYRYRKQHLEEFMAVPTGQITWSSLNKIGEDILFVIGDTLYTYKSGRFKKELEVAEPDFWYQIHGRNKKDMFLSTEHGMVHYNGENFQDMILIDQPVKSFSNNSMIFKRDVFFLVTDFESLGSSYIYHGTLSIEPEP